MASQGYITIQEWQRDLGLKGNELIAFAIIWGFAQESGVYTGSASYIAYWIGGTKRNAINILNKLQVAGLIVKISCPNNGVDTSTYAVNVSKVLEGGEKNSLVKKTHRGSEKFSHNNTKDKDIYNSLSNSACAKSKTFVRPTVAEVRAYCQERDNIVDAEQFCDFYESNGWLVGKNTMQDWKAAVRTWEKRRAEEAKQKQSAPRRSYGPKTSGEKFNDMLEVGRRLGIIKPNDTSIIQPPDEQ